MTTRPARPMPHPDEGHWNILIVDDETDVFRVSELAIGNLEHAGRGVTLTHADSGAVARACLDRQQFAVAVVDVVMETDDAGLRVVEHLRNTLDEQQTRIIIRTGQPGTAPEWATVVDHDINGYEDKASATAQRLKTAVLTALRGFDQLQKLERARARLERQNRNLHELVSTLRDLAVQRADESRTQRMLQNLCRMIGRDRATGAALVERRTGSGTDHAVDLIAAAVGELGTADLHSVDALPEPAKSRIRACLDSRDSVFEAEYSCVYTHSVRNRPRAYYIRHHAGREAAEDMVQLFCQNVTDASDASVLSEEVVAAQTEMVLVLSEAVEARSQETGNHVRRVGAYSRVLARELGLPEAEAKTLEIAAPLHDIGKVSIPDSVLMKPSGLTDEEWTLMKTHAEIGRKLLREHPQPVMRAAAIVAGEHHEKWDGSGYPLGLAGEDIHIYGRITAVADVFDAISSDRVYKDAWPLDKCKAHIQSLSGSQFDPAVVEAFNACFDELVEIRDQLAD